MPYLARFRLPFGPIDLVTVQFLYNFLFCFVFLCALIYAHNEAVSL